MENKKKIDKKIIIIISLVVLAVFGAMIVFCMPKDEEGYRVIQVYEVDGTATLKRENVGEMDAYENLNLLSGDWLSVLKESFLRLKMDEDKYMLIEQDSAVSIYATGSGDKTKTNIQLEKGAVTVEVQNKLSDDATFEVTTPNSVMAIRGTVFRIATEMDENGEPFTRISILEGSVSVQKKDKDGNVSEETLVEMGKEAVIYTENAEEVIEILDEISIENISVEALEFLKTVSENGRELHFDLEQIKEEIQVRENETTEDETTQNYTVTFLYHGEVFGTQEVKAGELVSKPSLLPAEKGFWNYDFATPITQDTVIEFVEE